MKPMRVLLAALLVLSTSPLLAAEENLRGSDPYETAKREFQQGNFDAALAALTDSAKRGEPTADSLVLKGRVYAEQQKYDEATEAFNAAYKSEPSSSARLHLADMYLRQKRWEEARGIYVAAQKETKLLIPNERLRYGVLIASLGAKDDEGARIAFEKLPFPSESAAYYYAQAAWAFAHGAKGDGEKWIRRADGIFPVKASAWFARPLYDFGWIKTKPPLVAE